MVVSNAAANPTVAAILDVPEPVLDKLWEINVKASILLLKVISVRSWCSILFPPSELSHHICKRPIIMDITWVDEVGKIK